MSVYVITAIDDDGVVKECIVVKSVSAAQLIYAALRKVWRNVAMISREVDDIPRNMLEVM